MKFLVDAMLGKLARFLRIFGYDTVYANDLIEYYNINPVPDNNLKEYAQSTNRIVITKDLPFYKDIMDNAILLEGEGVYSYLNQIKQKLKMQLNFNIQNARCSTCNSLLQEVTNKILIKNLVKHETFLNYNEFFQCVNPTCRKVFWNGPHIADINRRIQNMTEN
ncbi:MAG: DUF5615 family PIN-like protein [Candidatus Lokiarchaeota archaeon]|nr:DUF5615 family PIN-like protein [Candidatus Lokiarchaeota archaeon]